MSLSAAEREDGAAPRAAPGSLAAVTSRLSVRSLRVRMGTREVLSIWTRLHREPLDAVELPLPEVEAAGPGVARLRLRARRGHDHVELRIAVDHSERLVGFGERFNAVDQRGWKLESWTQEGAIGFGELLSPLLTRLGVRFNPWPTGPTYAYKPLPWMLSSKGYGLYFDTSAPVFFDVGATQPDVVVCEVARREVDVLVFYEGDPATMIGRLTERLGRPRHLPDWALAPWNDAVGGQQAVQRIARLLRERRIPSSVVWTEDWHGAEHRFFGDSRWSFYTIFPVMRRHARHLYAHLEELAQELHDAGFKFLGYYYPYVHDIDPHFEEAEARGYFLKDDRGRTRTFTVFMDRVAQIDLTNPDARAWYAKELEHGLELGFDGWMADFGEYTPVDTVTYDGEPGLLHHNRFPVLWAELNREVLERARPDGDWIFLSRAAGPGQQAVSPVLWCGDSNTDFEKWDGLPSNLPALLSAGLSGISIWTTDVGGYKSLLTRGRDKETFARWAEMSAFLAVMRTHHGTHPQRSVQFDHDEDTLACWTRWARAHTALFPLRRALCDEAMRNGLPVCRPLLLEYPRDRASWRCEDQFLLGAELLVAPVLERRAHERTVYLPPGRAWINLWTGRSHAGGRRVRVPAPLGLIPVFLRADGMLPTFDTIVDTLVRREQTEVPSLATLDDAERSLTLLLGPELSGVHTLYDGTRIELVEGDGPPDAPLEPAGAPGHALLPADMIASWRPVACGRGRSGALELGDGRWIRVESPIPRRITLRVVRAEASA